MRAMLRWLVISLLILTLPLKGLAAVGFMACGPLHAPAAHEQHEPHEPHEHVGDTEPTPAKAKIFAGMKCTQCAPCCAAVAAQATGLSLATEVESDTVQAWVQPLALGGDTDRLERPPRPQLG